jgi:hypothetical protein
MDDGAQQSTEGAVPWADAAGNGVLINQEKRGVICPLIHDLRFSYDAPTDAPMAGTG